MERRNQGPPLNEEPRPFELPDRRCLIGEVEAVQPRAKQLGVEVHLQRHAPHLRTRRSHSELCEQQ